MKKKLNLSKQDYANIAKYFSNIKAEDDIRNNILNINTFIQTKTFKKTKIEGKSIIIGRKGSGKTAFIEGFKLLNKQDYIAFLDYKFDLFPYDQLKDLYKDRLDKKASNLKYFKESWKYSITMAALQKIINYKAIAN
jgi:hypothetical protein